MNGSFSVLTAALTVAIISCAWTPETLVASLPNPTAVPHVMNPDSVLNLAAEHRIANRIAANGSNIYFTAIDVITEDAMNVLEENFDVASFMNRYVELLLSEEESADSFVVLYCRQANRVQYRIGANIRHELTREHVFNNFEDVKQLMVRHPNEAFTYFFDHLHVFRAAKAPRSGGAGSKVGLFIIIGASIMGAVVLLVVGLYCYFNSQRYINSFMPRYSEKSLVELDEPANTAVPALTETCPICKLEVTAMQITMRNPSALLASSQTHCSHIFHAMCVSAQKYVDGHCPECRQSLELLESKC